MNVLSLKLHEDNSKDKAFGVLRQFDNLVLKAKLERKTKKALKYTYIEDKCSIKKIIKVPISFNFS